MKASNPFPSRVLSFVLLLAAAPEILAQDDPAGTVTLITATAPMKHLELFNGRDFTGWKFKGGEVLTSAKFSVWRPPVKAACDHQMDH